MYQNFYKIDGSHPWREVGPEGYVDYPVRYRKGGKVLYFNFDLAREMGLISAKHPNRLNDKLEEAILFNFSIQILNEHDWMNKKRLPRDGLEDRLYMATRYLQLQHDNKQGKTSGDGRSIWNGYAKSEDRWFDVSSRGTGVTILSPGVQKAGELMPTGGNTYGYASGLAELDEMLATAVMSEIFYRQGIPTERCLAVIEYKDKTSVGVRTAPNLIRPAHVFRYLKSNEYDELKNSFDYFLRRQEHNKSWKLPKTSPARYQAALDYLTRTYARLVALLEEEYIFSWLAWDGDNMLADGALLDYGSIRQFASKHDKYRYDDVERFSTSLTEQKREARKIIQTFLQLVDYIQTKEKKGLAAFEDDAYLSLFDQCFKEERKRRMLYRVGFTDAQVERLLQKHPEKVKAFRKVLNYFEDIKIIEGEEEVPDGITHAPVFLVRHILRELPQYLAKNMKDNKFKLMPTEQFCELMAASYVDELDLVIDERREQKVIAFQQLYEQLICAAGQSSRAVLKSVVKRSKVINYAYRGTGDGLTWIINEALKVKDKMQQEQFQDTIERYIASQVLIPGEWKPIRQRELKGNSMRARLLRQMQAHLQDYHETI